MERSQLFDLMGELKLYGMKAAFDEIMATAVKRQHEPQRIVGDLLNAEIDEKQARSIKYQLTVAKLPLAKDLAGFVESFNGRLRDEWLNETPFSSIAHARVTLAEWRADYNANRPHSRLGWAATLVPARGQAAAQRGSFAPRPVAHQAQTGSTQQRILPIAG